MEIPTTPMPNPPKKEVRKLPPLRKGITLSFNDYDREGKPQWLIHDAGRNKFFIIGWSEYELLSRWSIGDAEKLVEAVLEQTTLHVDLDDVDHLLRFLAHNYLIQQSGYQIYKSAKDQKLFKKDNLFHWLINYYLFFRIPLWHPDKFLVRTQYIANIVFGKGVGYLMLVLGFVALYQLSTRWEQFTHTFPTIFTIEGLFFYFIAYTICKLFHELGHAYVCRSYGIPVPSLGVAFLVFWPVLYTDTTLSWPLDNKKRLRIALAGIWIETYVTIIAALLWCNVHNITVQSICYVTITINWMASLLINVSPFMRFDGYYVLADYLKMPNLQPRAFALTRWQIRHWLFHWSDPPPETFSFGMHRFLVAYSIFTWLYRLVLYFGIAVLVYHFFIKIIGILLFAIEVYYFILNPIVTEISSWVIHKHKFSLNRRTKITLFIAGFGMLCFFIPIKETIDMPGTLSYAHEFLVAPEESILASRIPDTQTEVKANQPIIKLISPEINNALREVQLGYDKMLNQLRRSSINQKYTQEKSTLLSDISKQQAKYQKLMRIREKLTLSVPFDGIVIDTDSELSPGTVIMKDEWLGDVINPNKIQGEAYVSQIDVNNLATGQTGYFYFRDESLSPVPVKIESIEFINTAKLICYYSMEVKQNTKNSIVVETPCYNASDLGGKVATFYTEEGYYVPVDSVFRVILSIQKPVKLSHVERGTIVIKTRSNSFAYRFFYKVKTTFIKQSGF